MLDCAPRSGVRMRLVPTTKCTGARVPSPDRGAIVKFRLTPFAAAFVAAVWLAGCASTNVSQPASSGSTAATGDAKPAAQSQVATVNTGSSDGANVAAADQKLASVVYFDFDSSIVKPEYNGTIDGYAKLLRQGQRKLTIEGHADERGGHEYNLALGQRRAESVRKSLELLGVKEDQVEAISYGEERPVAQGHDEESWAKNRRAEFKVR